MGLSDVRTDKRGFETPITPVSSGGMLRHAVSIDEIFNHMLNGEVETPFLRMLFTTPSAKTISAGSITPTLAMHTVTSESGTSDDLDTITAVNNSYLILKATATHTITLRSGAGNITVPGGNNVILTGNQAALLWCESSQWSHIGTYANKNNFIATRDPAPSDDSTAGYREGSLWVNTRLDRIWICVDKTATTAIWKLISKFTNWMRYRAAAATVQAIGGPAPTVLAGGIVVASNDSSNIYLQWNGTLTIHDNEGWSTTGNHNLVRPAQNPIIEFYQKSMGSISTSNSLTWIGLCSVNANESVTLSAGTKFIGFRFRSTTDTGLRPVLCDGTTQNTGAAIGTVADTTPYKLKMRVDGDNLTVYFSVNDGAETALSTNFPAVTTDMGLCWLMWDEIGGGGLNFKFSSVEVGW